ncbi:MAG TPA: chorismate mutase [Candidatus Baltobacteraceae bacterium]|jgi:chorismate mutase / prephenate dehydratase|nr:chorismate mutase [Candidatus Baltobacteraceae bacterium]
MKIDDWRRKIDAIDTAMLHLLNLRAELSIEVGRMKCEAGVPLRSKEREQEILTRMKQLNPGPLDAETIGKVYQLILDESIRTQTRFGYSIEANKDAARGGARKPARR